jgi:hypothetical protein
MIESSMLENVSLATNVLTHQLVMKEVDIQMEQFSKCKIATVL